MDKIDSGKLREELIAWRTSRGLSQESASAMFGVTAPAYRHWEAGRRNVPGAAARLLRIYAMLDIMAPNVLEGILGSATGHKGG